MFVSACHRLGRRAISSLVAVGEQSGDSSTEDALKRPPVRHTRASMSSPRGPEASAGQLERYVGEFARHGFCVLPDALDTAALARMRAAFDGDRAAHPRCWELRGSSRSVSVPTLRVFALGSLPWFHGQH